MDYGNLKVPENVTPEVQAILDSYEARNKEIERNHKKEMAKLYGGAALQIGSAFIPGTLGLKAAGGAIKALTPYVGKKIAENVATGTISGLASGAVEGLGRGLMEGENPLKTMVSDATLGTLFGGAFGLAGGKIGKKLAEKNLQNNNIAPQKYFDDYVAGLAESDTLGKASPFSKEFGKFRGLRDSFTPVSKNTGSEFLFAGENALNADNVALNKARELFGQGVDNEEIRQLTGWFKGVDGKWRYEIPSGEVKLKDFFYNKYDDMIKTDYEMVDLFRERGWDDKIDDYLKNAEENKVILDKINNNFNEDIVKNYGNFNTKLPNIYKNDDLYSAYPELSNTNIRFSNEERPSTIAYFDPSEKGKNGIIINTDFEGFSLDNLKRNLAHEIQHYIQNKENFAKGGQYNGNWEEYFNLAGEVEARLAEKRYDLSAIDKKNINPLTQFDVEPEKQVIKFNDNNLYQKLIDNEEFDYNKVKNLAKDLRNGEHNPLKYKAKDAKIDNISPRQREYIFNEVNTTASDVEKEKGLVTRRLHNYDEEVDYLYTIIYDKDGKHKITRSIKIDENFYDKP